MLSSLIRWNSKRKGNKVEDNHSFRPIPSPPPFSPFVFNIKEESEFEHASPSSTQGSLLVDINVSVSNESWFPQELPRSRSYAPRSPFHRGYGAKVAQNNTTQLNREDTSLALSSHRSEDTSPRNAARKKSIPAPIIIPDVELRAIPNIQIRRSPTPVPVHETSQSNVTEPFLNPPSPSPSDNLSSISGATLPHALIASTFVLTSSERRSLRHRSGIGRQDSATLPRRESCLVSDSARPSPIPPVPPLPVMIAGGTSHLAGIQSGASTVSGCPLSDTHITSPEPAIDPKISGQISCAQQVSSQAVSTSVDAAPFAAQDAVSKENTGLVPGCPRAFKDDVFDGPRTAVEIPLLVNIQGIAPHSSPEISDVTSSGGHSLDEFDFVPLEPLVMIGSAASDSSASYTSPLHKCNDVKRKRRFGGSNFVRNGFKDQSDATLASHQASNIPSATVSEHDYGELFNCEVTVNPGSSSSSQFLSSGSAGHQTFPETPMAFSPLWSPVRAPPVKSDSQVPRRHPPTPVSLRPRVLYSSIKNARLQFEKGHGVGGLFRRSRTPLLPRQGMHSPRVYKSSLLQINDTQGVSEEQDQSSTMARVESQDLPVPEADVNRHPLTYVPTSCPSLPEEEALQALARRSSSSSPSIVINSTDALLDALPNPSPVIDPASIPLLESTDGSPFNSPARVDSVMAGATSTSPRYSPLPTSTTAVSQPSASKCTQSDSSSFPEEPSLPSPSPAPSHELPPRPLSPTPAPTSPVLSDDSISVSFFPPPPYHTVVSERTAYYSASPSTLPPSASVLDSRHSRQTADSFRIPSRVRNRGRTRPPLPVGPREPNSPRKPLESFSPRFYRRNGSRSSVSSSGPSISPGSPWHTLRSAATKPPPKFQMPPPKWRGLTLEAARWTFTSGQLQAVVSHAIQQSSDSSSIRLLRLEVLEGEIADEVHRLELQHTDIKMQYRALMRKRWMLIGNLVSRIEGKEMMEAARTMEMLVEVLSTLDQLADRMHDIVVGMSQLKSLRDVHNASALALATRKINSVFVRQVAEKERLQERLDTLKTERDEAWKHAEDIAKDYDALNDRISERTVRAADDTSSGDTQSLESTSKCLTRISAVRKSCDRLSQAGLRSRSRHRPSHRSSGTTTRLVPIEPNDIIPPMPHLPIGLKDGPTIPPRKSFRSTYSCRHSSTPEALTLAQAQLEVYEMLGLNLSSGQASSLSWRPQSLPDTAWKPARRLTRPASETLESLHARMRLHPDRTRAAKSVVLESNRHGLKTPRTDHLDHPPL